MAFSIPRWLEKIRSNQSVSPRLIDYVYAEDHLSFPGEGAIWFEKVQGVNEKQAAKEAIIAKFMEREDSSDLLWLSLCSEYFFVDRRCAVSTHLP